jgi:hypothetical protein
MFKQLQKHDAVGLQAAVVAWSQTHGRDRHLIYITSEADSDKLALALQRKVFPRKMDSDLRGC